jgi:hypothetical protein
MSNRLNLANRHNHFRERRQLYPNMPAVLDAGYFMNLIAPQTGYEPYGIANLERYSLFLSHG